MTAQPTRDQLRALANAATEGPWELIGGGEYVSGPGILVAPDDGGVTSADAEFIAAARTAVPQLLDQLERAEADRDWNLRSSRIAKKERIEANARAEKAEQRARDLTQEVRDERGAALDQMEQVAARDKRIGRLENRAASETARANAWRDKHRIMAEKRDAARRAWALEYKARRDAETRIKAVQDVLDTWMTYCQTEQTTRALSEIQDALRKS